MNAIFDGGQIWSNSLLFDRDQDKEPHDTRTSWYVRLLAKALRKDRELQAYITSKYIRDLGLGARYHDCGKVGVPEEVLKKPGPLDDREMVQVRVHPLVGRAILEQARNRPRAPDFLDLAISIAGSHHEWWDGSGYPEGLSHYAIPLSARIMAVADVYDALRSSRPYKEPWDHEPARDYILHSRGVQFDPRIVDAFLSCEFEFKAYHTLVGPMDPGGEVSRQYVLHHHCEGGPLVREGGRHSIETDGFLS